MLTSCCATHVAFGVALVANPSGLEAAGRPSGCRLCVPGGSGSRPPQRGGVGAERRVVEAWRAKVGSLRSIATSAPRSPIWPSACAALLRTSLSGFLRSFATSSAWAALPIRNTRVRIAWPGAPGTRSPPAQRCKSRCASRWQVPDMGHGRNFTGDVCCSSVAECIAF